MPALRFYLPPLLAIIGIIMAVRTVVLGSIPQVVAPPVAEPPKPPFAQYVAGAGIIEAVSENISIASPLAGIVKGINVRVGDTVKTGDPLFSLDDRDQLADLETKKAAVNLAQSELAQAKDQWAMISPIANQSAVSKETIINKRSNVAITEAKLAKSIAEMHQLETTIERMTVRAPIDSTVLQIKVRLGEFAPAQQISTPLILLGDVSKLAVRTDIDENDAWRVKAGSNAVAYLRGNASISTPLTFLRFEPYVVPKRSLTGESTERVDTRVLQAIYAFDPKDLPVFVGQLMDVYIENKG